MIQRYRFTDEACAGRVLAGSRWSLRCTHHAARSSSRRMHGLTDGACAAERRAMSDAHRTFWVQQFDAKPVDRREASRASPSQASSSCFAGSLEPDRAKARRSTTWVSSCKALGLHRTIRPRGLQIRASADRPGENAADLRHRPGWFPDGARRGSASAGAGREPPSALLARAAARGEGVVRAEAAACSRRCADRTSRETCRA